MCVCHMNKRLLTYLLTHLFNSDPAGWKTARNLISSFSGKLMKMVATKCHILRRKCTKFDFGWGSAPDPAGGAYSAPPDLLAGIQGPTAKGRGGDKKIGKRKGGKERGKG